MTQIDSQSEFVTKFRTGSFTSALRWENLDALWEVLRANVSHDWYIYAIGSEVPKLVSTHDTLRKFINEIDKLLREEHDEDYCGIVYADSLQEPTMVKIFDPNNLGVSCGYSDNPPLPGWVLSKLRPVDLLSAQVVANNRKRWWSRLFG